MGKRGVQINAEAIDLSNALTIKYDLQVDSGVWKISGDFRFNAAGEFTNGNARLDFRGSDGSRLTWYISGPPREVGIKGGHRWLIGGGFFFQIQGDYNFSTRNFQGMAYFGYDGDSK
ncbi:MAG TPA: hypothetical protein VD865_06820 [Stenotrophomonas sp.]|nr:hypothetical protein [Stenotrophomonas sp.]